MSSSFRVERTWVGAVQSVIFDWAGTTVDFGSRAPAGIFVEVFRRAGVEVTIAEAREPMGMQKRAHIARMAAMPRVAAAWQTAHGRPITDADIDAMYASFVPLQLESVAGYADVIPGVLETVAALRQRGIRVGSTTGYSDAIMEIVCREATARGYTPDVVVASDAVPAGRPAPWMLFRAAEALGTWPMRSVVAVDDTVAGIEAALNAGAWAVGVAVTGNMVGLSHSEWTALDPAAQERMRAKAYADLYAAGAHYVVDGVGDLLPVIDRISSRLQAP